MNSEGPPEGRCGFVLRPEDVEGVHSNEDLTDWHENTEAICCWRETWNGRQYCIWHSKIHDLPIEELASSRQGYHDRFDGAELPNLENDGTLSFNNSGLLGSNLFNSSLENGSFWDADLRYANLESVDFRKATLDRADLRNANLKEGVELDEASLRKTDLRNANIEGGYLEDADLWKSQLQNANLKWAHLKGAHFYDSELQGANLQDAELEATDLRKSNLTNVNLEDASLVRTDLRGANLQNVQLYQTYFSDVRINSDTEFGDSCVYDHPDKLDDDWDDRWDATPTEAAVWTYRRLQDLHEKYALTERARHYHIKKEEAEKKRHWEEGNWKQWAIYKINGELSEHGERPWRVVRISLYVIGIWSLLYYLFGEIRISTDFSGTETIGLAPFSAVTVPTPLGGTLVSFLDQITTSIYFSAVTFTTLGYGDLQPASGFTRALTTVESFVGALLMAYLVFVLGRRTDW